MRALALIVVACVSIVSIALAQDAGAPATSSDVIAPGEAVDFDIEETSGTIRNLRDLRGQVVILWYEDRDHTDTNYALKLELHEFIVDNHLEDDITTYGVANVHGIDGVIRDLARSAIRGMAQRYGIQILLDWNGALMQAPFSCADGDANFMLIDRQGRIRYRHTGEMMGSHRTEMYRVLRRLLHEAAAP
jgi:cytochrome oxidase Cu insertion factor (SCO1/SenC/PrrC family)